jgi:hypothetical protein
VCGLFWPQFRGLHRQLPTTLADTEAKYLGSFMENDESSVWARWTKSSPVWVHEDLRSESLPEDDGRSVYAVDLAGLMTTYIAFESLGIKISSAHARNVWDRLYPVVAFGFALGELAVMTRQKRIVSSVNAAYLRSRLDSYVEGLGVLAGRPDDLSEDFAMDAAAVSSRVSRMVDVVVQQAGGHYRRKTREPLFRMAVVSSEVLGAIAAVESIWPYVSAEPRPEMYRPLWASPE